MTTRLVRIADLAHLLRVALRGIGVPDDEALVTAQICLEAELLGRTTHGIRLVGNIRREYEAGASRRRDIAIELPTPSTVVIDGGFHCSPYLHAVAADAAADAALRAGIGMASVRNAGVSGALGLHAERIAQRGLVGIALNSAPAVVVPPGSARPALGTNPLAVAVPASDGNTVVLDMSTSATSFNQLLLARDAGTALPEGVAVDDEGHPTRDPAKAFDSTGRARLLPFGGHRGFGLALMIELLVAAGVGGTVGRSKIGPVLTEPSHFPGLYIAYRPDAAGDAASFAGHIEQLLAELEADGVRIPGQVSARRRTQAQVRGTVDVAVESLVMLDHLAHGEPGDVADAHQQAARRLTGAVATRTPCAAVRDLIGADDVAAAYRVQRCFNAGRIAAGAIVVGRKIGATSKAVQEQLGVDQPDFGVLLDEMRVEEGEIVALDRLLQPKVEAEIAFVLAKDLAEGPLDVGQVRDAIDYAVAALEIVDSRIAGWDISFADTVADNASSGLFVLGATRRTLAELEPSTVEMSMTVNGETASTGNGAACLGDPLHAVAWLAEQAREFGDPLRAGQVILSGALGPMRPVTPGAVVTAHITGLGTVTARFSGGDAG